MAQPLKPEEAQVINKILTRLLSPEVKKRLSYNPLVSPSKKRGIALILAVTSLVFMVYIASEVTKDSAVEFIVNSQELTRLKAYYAARNGMQIALLRIKLFQQASKLSLPESFASQLDLIWKFPFSWPLPIGDVNTVDKELMQKTTAASLMDGSYAHTIEDEGSKIDINDLASPSKVLRELTKKQLLNVFEQKLSADDEFRTSYQSTNFEELVNHIYDWMSDTTTSAAGGDKRAAYSSLGEGYPPNRGFRTIEEVRLVPGMSDEFFNLLAPRITIYGMKAINPNTASKEVLMSLDSGMTEEAANAAIEKRESKTDSQDSGPFKGNGEECLQNFKTFVLQKGARLTPEFDQIPMLCSKVYNFRIKSTGVFGEGQYAFQKTIVAITIDIAKSATQIKTYVDKEKKDSTQQQPPPQDSAAQPPPAGQTAGTTTQEPLPKGPPRVIYWSEN
jgi:general secretion pathway protein K